MRLTSMTIQVLELTPQIEMFDLHLHVCEVLAAVRSSQMSAWRRAHVVAEILTISLLSMQLLKRKGKQMT